MQSFPWVFALQNHNELPLVFFVIEPEGIMLPIRVYPEVILHFMRELSHEYDNTF
jgi:hypothetical protein